MIYHCSYSDFFIRGKTLPPSQSTKDSATELCFPVLSLTERALNKSSNSQNKPTRTRNIDPIIPTAILSSWSSRTRRQITALFLLRVNLTQASTAAEGAREGRSWGTFVGGIGNHFMLLQVRCRDYVAALYVWRCVLDASIDWSTRGVGWAVVYICRAASWYYN